MSEPTPNPNIAENNAREEGRQEEAWRLRPHCGIGAVPWNPNTEPNPDINPRCHQIKGSIKVCALGTQGCHVTHFDPPTSVREQGDILWCDLHQKWGNHMTASCPDTFKKTPPSDEDPRCRVIGKIRGGSSRVCNLGTVGCVVIQHEGQPSAEDRARIVEAAVEGKGTEPDSKTLLDVIATIRGWISDAVLDHCPCCGRPR